MVLLACSMALGEWISVQSSRELYHHQIGIEARELEDIPAEEEEELKLIYQSKGLSEDAAGKLAHDLISDKSTALKRTFCWMTMLMICQTMPWMPRPFCLTISAMKI